MKKYSREENVLKVRNGCKIDAWIGLAEGRERDMKDEEIKGKIRWNFETDM